MSKDFQFSFYRKPIRNTKPEKTINCSELYQLITQDESIKEATSKLRELEGDKKKEFKTSAFDSITSNGIFESRSDKALKEPSGLMILDIDHQSDASGIKDRIAKDKELNPVLMFISPSGDGLKVLLPIDSTLIRTGQKKAMSSIWDAVNGYMKKNYSDIITPDEKGNYIDASGVDISRACFICHDPDAYFNPDVEVTINANFMERYTSTSTIPNRKPLKADRMTRYADKHFLKENNRNTQVVSFVGACVNDYTITEERAIEFINTSVSFAPDSSHFNNPQKTQSTVRDIFQRYRKQVLSEPIYLDTDKFAVDIFLFKYSPKIGYLLHGLYRTGIADYLSSQGFYKKYINGKSSLLIHADGNVIDEMTVEKVKDVLSSHVERLGDIAFMYHENSFNIPHQALRNVYLSQSHLIFNDKWLQHLNTHTMPFLKDTVRSSLYAFQNGLVEVTSDAISDPVPYQTIGDKCIWKSQIIKRDFINKFHEDDTQSEFSKFVSNVCDGDDKRVCSLTSAIGYLMHAYSIPSRTKAVILNDEEVTTKDKPEGGTGKGLIANAIKQLKPLVVINGKQFDNTDKFQFQQIEPSTQVAWLDDPRPDFEFSSLFSAITDGLTVERKYLPKVYFEPSESPKWIITSNTVLSNEGNSNKRRQYVVEFSNHYVKKYIKGNKEPIVEEHNGNFFTDDWSKEEWNLFYNWMLLAVMFYLKGGLVDQPVINSLKNRLMQTTEPEFIQWVDAQNFITNKEYQTKAMFHDYVSTYYGDSSKFPQKRFSKWVKLYAASVNWQYESIRSNGIDYFTFKPIF